MDDGTKSYLDSLKRKNANGVNRIRKTQSRIHQSHLGSSSNCRGWSPCKTAHIGARWRFVASDMGLSLPAVRDSSSRTWNSLGFVGSTITDVTSERVVCCRA